MALPSQNNEPTPRLRALPQAALRPAKSDHEKIIHLVPEKAAPDRGDPLEIAARATHDVVRDWDVASGAIRWTANIAGFLGHEAPASAGHVSFWHESIHPADRERVCISLRDALAGPGERWTGEYRFRRADGSYAQVLERALILRAPDGRSTRFVGSMMDITERVQLQEQIVRSQKMEAFGQLAGGLAHDFNNFLTAILGYSDLLLTDSRIKGEVAGHIGEIKKSGLRASALTGQLLAFSRRQPLEPKVLDVNSMLANMERSLLRLLGENIDVGCNLHPVKEPAHIRVDPGQITQIILNLAVNARDAMRHGGRLTIEASSIQIQAGHPVACGFENLTPGDYAVISLTDTGVGMSDEVKAHLFEPFFTTKTEPHGSGLGLATSYGIVRQSGGHICIESELGKGTTVRIFLPKVEAPPALSYRRPNLQKMPAGSETILVLEDEVSVRHIAVRILRKLGYDVIEAGSADDAQRLIAARNGSKIDLLLTDMVMPGMSGRLFADWLRGSSPATKVMFTSGYLEESLHPSDRRDADMFFLPKPFDPEQLAGKVREALDAT